MQQQANDKQEMEERKFALAEDVARAFRDVENTQRELEL